MRLEVVIDGNLTALMADEVRAGERAVSAAMRSAGASLKAAWRGQITGAGLGNRLANTIRNKTYPEGQPSMGAAALIYSRASKVVGAHDAGPLIRSKHGFWLAIPTKAAGRGERGARITPGQWEQRTGRRLRFIYRRGKPGLLVDDGTKAPGNVMVRKRRMVAGRRDYYLSEPTTFRNRLVPIFILVPQVRLRKRLDLNSAALAAHAALPSQIIAHWRGAR